MDDRTEGEAGAGDVVAIAPGHDVWIVGDEPCVFLDFQGGQGYAKPASSSAQSRSDANLFYDLGDKGCTEVPLEQVAQLARGLSGGQTLEIRATNPSVVHDLPA